MNKRIISTLQLTILSITALASMIGSAYAQGATVAVDPSQSAADVGQSFTVAVTVADVSDFVAYDVTLLYDFTSLTASSVSFNIGPLQSVSHFDVAQIADDLTGTIRSARTALGGVSVNVGAPEAVIEVTFMVLAAVDSTLDVTGTELVAKDLNGNAVSVEHESLDGAFNVPPTIFNVHDQRATVASSQRQRFLSRGEHHVDLLSAVQMDPLAPRAGFGGILFTVVDPNGNAVEVPSGIAFMFPGESAGVTAVYTYGDTQGTYAIFATTLRCSGPDSCVAGDTFTGKFFKVRN